LLFVGQTGTGKSFFAIAIAQELCSQGYWVEFESALEYCNIAETAHFSRDSTHLDTMEKFFACDLFVLDDLGMEFQTSFSASAIYDIVNRRIQAHKSTVITTNLNKDALSETYHPQTISRLLGEYAVIALKGNDLRISE
jgi:DNA replication protein DnaC